MMINMFAIRSIARYEAKLLFRSWAFRIFSILGLVILFGMTLGIGSRFTDAPHFLRALSGSMALANIKMLNVYQGIIAAFLATEYFKRDRRHDTTEVVFTRSYSNVDYLLGKLIGITAVFAALNAAVLLMTLIIHLFFSDIPFTLMPYLYYTAVIALPTVVFMMGLSIFLVTVLRSQAVVFALMLGYSLLVVIFAGRYVFTLFDAYGFYQPIIYSDFIGAGNLLDVLLLRGAYLCLGLALLAATILFSRRLQQSPVATTSAVVLSVVAFVAAFAMGGSYLAAKYDDGEYRGRLQALSRTVAEQPIVTISAQDIDISFDGDGLTAAVGLDIANGTPVTLDSLLVSLNPGLTVTGATWDGADLRYRRDEHLLWLFPASPLAAGESGRVNLAYEGTIDERYCFLDVEDDRLSKIFRLWLYTFPKRYAVVSPEYVYLNSEAGWYPVAGLAPGAAFPDIIPWNFSRYRLTVTVPAGLTAISQGPAVVDSAAGEHRVTFAPEVPLPRLSLTMGQYQKQSIEVDSIEYALYVRPGHDYYSQYFTDIADTLPAVIRDIKSDYESMLGLAYPYKRLAIVETPVQIYAYDRLWTTAHETVQPQIIHMPELGAYSRGTDFNRMKRNAKRRQERANQADDPKTIQAGYLLEFAQVDLLEQIRNFRGTGDMADIEPFFNILPNYLSFQTHLSSQQWPVLQYAFESYFSKRVAPPQVTRWRIWQGLTDPERANLALKEFSLADLIAGRHVEQDILKAALQAKGNLLFARLEASADTADFVAELTGFIDDNRYRSAGDDRFVAFADRLGQPDFAATLDAWYGGIELPGYMIDEVDSYNVLDGERTKSQLKFQITNPTDVSGLVELNLRYRRQNMRFGGWMQRVQEQYDFKKMIFMPPRSRRQIAYLLEQPPAEINIETFVSQNIPSVLSLPFREQKTRSNEVPVEMDSLMSLVVRPVGDAGEYLIDNEDAGFQIVGVRRENWLRRSLRSLFNASDSTDPYVGIRFWDPPGYWVPTTGQYFYGTFIRSAFQKEAGNGDNKVCWTAEMAEGGDYDVYYYFEGEEAVPRWGRRHRRTAPQGQRQFLIYHEDGVEETALELDIAEEGWNYLGTYRLTAGKNRIELTDKNNATIVIADAVKWVKR